MNPHRAATRADGKMFAEPARAAHARDGRGPLRVVSAQGAAGALAALGVGGVEPGRLAGDLLGIDEHPARGQRAAHAGTGRAWPCRRGGGWPWDAIVSALAIHHLDDPAKRDLFARVRGALAPGGVFVNAEQVAGETPWLDAAYVERHERAARALGADDAEWAAAVPRMSHDRCATVCDQLASLRGAGFMDAGCLWRDGRFAVLVARAAA